MRKLLTIALSLILLLSIPTNTLAATNPADDPLLPSSASIEAILSVYHTKVFTNEPPNSSDGSVGLSRMSASNTQSLEQEVVSVLNDVGHEAYNVTNSNYQDIEAALSTDFSELDLDTTGSYVIVVSGEDWQSDDTSNSNGIGTGPDKDFYDDDGGGASPPATFTYTYSGETYTMRYLIVTAADDTSYLYETLYNLSDIENVDSYKEMLLEGFISISLEEIFSRSTAFNFISLMADWLTDDNLTIWTPSSASIYAMTNWTREYIQVLDEETGMWVSCQCSAYATTATKCTGGFAYNPETNRPESIEGVVQTHVTYSPLYFSLSERKLSAALSSKLGGISWDRTGYIRFFFESATGEINLNLHEHPLFWHVEPS